MPRLLKCSVDWCYAGRPEDSGIALQTVKELGAEFPIFGVCMGHQCIGQVFGGAIVRAPSGVMLGKTSPVHHCDTGLLKASQHKHNAYIMRPASLLSSGQLSSADAVRVVLFRAMRAVA